MTPSTSSPVRERCTRTSVRLIVEFHSFTGTPTAVFRAVRQAGHDGHKQPAAVSTSTPTQCLGGCTSLRLGKAIVRSSILASRSAALVVRSVDPGPAGPTSQIPNE